MANTPYQLAQPAAQLDEGEAAAENDAGLPSSEGEYGLRGWGQFKSAPLTRIDGRVRRRLAQWDGADCEGLLNEVGLLAVQYALQLALEREAVGSLGRLHYARRGHCEAASRNGYRTLIVRVSEAPLHLQRPKFRHASDDRPRSALFSRGRVEQEALSRLRTVLIQALTPDAADTAGQLADCLAETLASAGVTGPGLAQTVLSEFRSTLGAWRRRLAQCWAEARSRQFAVGGDLPPYLVASLGRPPASPNDPMYALWLQGAAEIDRYRLGHGVTDPDTVFGDHPYEDFEEIQVRRLVLTLRREMARPGSELASPPPPEVWGACSEIPAGPSEPRQVRRATHRRQPRRGVLTLPAHQFFSAEYIYCEEVL
jgi:hypothetical protein